MKQRILFILTVLFFYFSGCLSAFASGVQEEYINVGETRTIYLPSDVSDQLRTALGNPIFYVDGGADAKCLDILGQSNYSVTVKALSNPGHKITLKIDYRYKKYSRSIEGYHVIRLTINGSSSPGSDPGSNPDPNVIKYGDDFTAKTVEGISMRFKVTNTEKKYCMVTKIYGQDLPSIDISSKGAITIPSVITGTTDKGLTARDYTVTNIGNAAFRYCAGINSVTIPNTVTVIDSYAFQGCESLTNITIGNSVTTIGYNAFANTNISSIIIPKSVKVIDDKAFRLCPNLSSIEVEDGNLYYDSRNGCNGIIDKSTNKLIFGCKGTVIPPSVSVIGREAFYQLSGVDSYTISNNVTKIEEDAFFMCTIKEIVLPSSLTSIESTAFISKKLVTVKANMINPPAIPEDVFSNIKDATLYVPKGCKSKYQSTPGWTNFVIYEMSDSKPKLTLTASPSGGQVSSGTTIKLTAKADASTVSGCDIYYTLNGTTPTKTSTKYTSTGITINTSCTLRAIAFKDGYETSDILTASYTVNQESPNLSIVSFVCDNTNLSNLTKNDKLVFHVTFKNSGGTGAVKTAVKICDSDMYTKYSGVNNEITFRAGETVTVDYVYDMKDVAPGNYKATVMYLKFYNDEDQWFWTYYDTYLKDITVKDVNPSPEIDIVSVICNNANPSELTQDDILTLRAIFKNSGPTSKVSTALVLLNNQGTKIMYNGDIYENEFANNREYTHYYQLPLKDVVPGEYLATVVYYNENSKEWIYKYVISIRVKATTGIDEVKMDINNNNRIFNMSGQKLDKPQKGINIINGRKVVVK